MRRVDYSNNKPSQTRINCEAGRHLWTQFTQVVFLTQQWRAVDTQFNDLLNRCATGSCTDDDFALLSTRIVGVDGVRLDSEKFKDAQFVVSRNAVRTQFNNRCVREFAAAGAHPIYVSFAVDTHLKSKLSQSLQNRLRDLPESQTKSLCGALPLAIGMSVALTENLGQYGVSMGLANGTVGVIRAIYFDDDGDGHSKSRATMTASDDVVWNLSKQPSCVLVHFPSCTFKLGGLPMGWVPVKLTRASFTISLRAGRKRVSIRRQQFPLVPAYALTNYKCQGLTMDSLIADLLPADTRDITSAWAYVILSRVRRLLDLVILRNFPIWVLQLGQSPELEQELKRLTALAAKTTQQFADGTLPYSLQSRVLVDPPRLICSTNTSQHSTIPTPAIHIQIPTLGPSTPVMSSSSHPISLASAPSESAWAGSGTELVVALTSQFESPNSQTACVLITLLNIESMLSNPDALVFKQSAALIDMMDKNIQNGGDMYSELWATHDPCFETNRHVYISLTRVLSCLDVSHVPETNCSLRTRLVRAESAQRYMGFVSRCPIRAPSLRSMMQNICENRRNDTTSPLHTYFALCSSYSFCLAFDRRGRAYLGDSHPRSGITPRSEVVNKGLWMKCESAMDLHNHIVLAYDSDAPIEIERIMFAPLRSLHV